MFMKNLVHSILNFGITDKVVQTFVICVTRHEKSLNELSLQMRKTGKLSNIL